MKLLLLGCTGEIGRLVFRRAQVGLKPSQITILVRNKKKLEELFEETLLKDCRVSIDIIFNANAINNFEYLLGGIGTVWFVW